MDRALVSGSTLSVDEIGLLKDMLATKELAKLGAVSLVAGISGRNSHRRITAGYEDRKNTGCSDGNTQNVGQFCRATGFIRCTAGV